MATYSCRVYKSTGFNSENIPDSLALLNQCSYIDVPAFDIMQERNLAEIRGKASWEQVKDADYCTLSRNGSTWCYIVTNVIMLNEDTFSLSVVQDYITSVGGINALNIVDGITERVHVSDDSYGLYDEQDPLLAPTKVMDVVTQWVLDGTEGQTVAEALLDIAGTTEGRKSKSYIDPAIKELYPDDLEEQLKYATMVPSTISASHIATDFRLGNQILPKPQTVLIPLTGDVAAGENSDDIADLRSLGLEQSIINQVVLPTQFVETHRGEQSGEGSYIGRAVGKSSNVPISSIPYRLHQNVKNQKLNYSDYEKYGIITMAGNMSEFEPYSIMEQGATYPSLGYKADPHTDGRPYFRFKCLNGDSSDRNWWRNAVPGLQWKQVPLIFSTKHGSILDQVKFTNQRFEKAMEHEIAKGQPLVNVFQSGLQNLGNMASGEKPDLLGMLGTAANTMISREVEENRYGMNTLHANQEFALEQNAVVPSLNFPYQAELLRDSEGNGCMVYRYKYSDFDVQRIDKLLTAYGYRYTKLLEKSDFTNRQNFNFVKAHNVTVSNGPRWISDGIAAQLQGGVRVWHRRVDPSLYTTGNPIRS